MLAIKDLNLDPMFVKEARLFQFHELEGFRFLTYENAKL